MFQKSRKPPENRTRINEWIRVSEVQVIGADGVQLGVLPTAKALQMAREQDLDLVEVGPQAKPPLVKILDFGKYQYEKERKEKAHKSKSRAQEMKSVRLGFRTDSHDLMVKRSQISKFLQKGYRVQIEMRLRGREKGMTDMAQKKLRDFVNSIEDDHIVDTPVRAVMGRLDVQIRPK